MANDSCELPFYSISNDQFITLFEAKVRDGMVFTGSSELPDYLDSLYSVTTLKEIDYKCMTEEHFTF